MKLKEKNISIKKKTQSKKNSNQNTKDQIW
jgi:hypothetical protein